MVSKADIEDSLRSAIWQLERAQNDLQDIDDGKEPRRILEKLLDMGMYDANDDCIGCQLPRHVGHNKACPVGMAEDEVREHATI